jgi:nucleoside-diphosphate-sugar epimerase
LLIDAARRTGVAGYLGDGSNRWPAVARRDAARLFRLAVELAPAGSVLHGAAEDGIPFRDIAAAIARNLNLSTASIPADQAQDQFGFLAAFAGLDNPTSSAITRDLLGWNPDQPGLIADLDADPYFAVGTESKYEG